MTELNRTEYLLLVLSVDSQNIQGKLDQTYNLVQFYCFREKVELRGGDDKSWSPGHETLQFSLVFCLLAHSLSEE